MGREPEHALFFLRMLLQVHHRVEQGPHLKAVGADNAALGHVAVLDVEGPGGAGGQDVAGVPALNAAVEGYQPGGAVGHIGHHVFGINFPVVD